MTDDDTIRTVQQAFGGNPYKVFGNGMHDFVMDDLEVGQRAAHWLDEEAAGWSALTDLAYMLYVTRDRKYRDGLVQDVQYAKDTLVAAQHMHDDAVAALDAFDGDSMGPF